MKNINSTDFLNNFVTSKCMNAPTVAILTCHASLQIYSEVQKSEIILKILNIVL